MGSAFLLPDHVEKRQRLNLHFDAGYGRDRINRENETLVSAGIGAFYHVDRLSASMGLSVAPDDGQDTQSGDVEFKIRAMIRF